MNYLNNIDGSPLLPPQALTYYFIFFTVLLIAAYFVTHHRLKPPHFKARLKLFLITVFILKAFLIAGGILVLAYWLLPKPTVESTSPKINAEKIAPNQKIEIVFDRPISRKDLEKSITPETPGEWVFEDAFYTTHLYRKVVFYPTISLKPDTEYQIKLSHIQNLTTISAPYDYQFKFKTQQSPKIIKLEPNNNTNDLEITSPLKVYLDNANDSVSQFDFELTPQTPIEISLDKTKSVYTITPKQSFKQGSSYELKIRKTNLIWNLDDNTIVSRETTNEDFAYNFKTKEAPGIANFSPSVPNAFINSPITITFSQAMDQKSIEDKFSIEPKISGKFLWTDNKTLVFQPDQLIYGTSYMVKIQKGAKVQNGSGFLEEDINNTFSTIGRIKVTSIYPTNNWNAVKIDAAVKITFDQEVNKLSAQSHFSINPKIDGAFSWSGNTLVFQPSSTFGYTTSYTVTLTPGIKSIHGLDFNTTFTSTFTTQDKTVKLSVPAYLQKYSLSCELASLRMALAFRGVNISEDTILSQLGIDNTAHQGNIWGNPYQSFVGNVKGRQMIDGYGVYWGPIARVANLYRQAQDFEAWGISQLTDAIAGGNPVVIWVYSSGGYPTQWFTTDGQKVFAASGEHAVVAVGCVGKPYNPSQLIINDPLSGQVYWTRSLFDKKWQTFNRSGVVVF